MTHSSTVSVLLNLFLDKVLGKSCIGKGSIEKRVDEVAAGLDSDDHSLLQSPGAAETLEAGEG